ncbi:MAG: type III pantothenate kinase [Proteobacteria bacterium]|nr:type III pantothenate kinase [Pseudomonadota bacterium]MDA0994308.1 type III pantothenate kinase [Pseudomonadota bacterium]
MSGRALLMDVGNNRLKWGTFDKGRIIRTGSIRHDAIHVSGFSALTSKLPRDPDSVLVSNVAGPGFAAKLIRVLGIHCNVETRFARSEKSAFGVHNGYRQPRQMGVDRWAAMIGARAEFKSALCIVDAGTAVTIDVLDRDGQHLGGQIIPGLHLMARGLESETSGINGLRIRPGDPGTGMGMFANGTERAVRAGALNAICGAIERAVRTMRVQGYRPGIILTGGGASRILKQLDGKVIHRPHLVLQGLAFMLQNHS